MKLNGKIQGQLFLIDKGDSFLLTFKGIELGDQPYPINSIEISANELKYLSKYMIPLLERLQGKYATLQEAYQACKEKGLI